LAEESLDNQAKKEKEEEAEEKFEK